MLAAYTLEEGSGDGWRGYVPCTPAAVERGEAVLLGREDGAPVVVVREEVLPCSVEGG